MGRGSAALAGGLVLAVVIAGCGGGGSKTVTVGGSTPPATVAQTSTGSASTSTTSTPSTPSLATANSSWDGNGARIDIVKLERTGGVTALTVRLSNEDADDAGSLQVTELFDDGVAEDNKTDNLDTMDGIALIDTVNRKKYVAGRDSTGACACDVDLGGTFVEPGRSVNLSASFGVPPPSVHSVSVFVPHFGTFKDVPIS